MATLIDRQPIKTAEKPRPGRVRRFFSIQVGPTRPTERQVAFAFRARTDRLERTFKRLIVLGTVATLALLVFAFPTGRFWTGWLATRARRLAMSSIGAVADRGEIDAEWRSKRLLNIKSAYGTLEQAFAEYTPAAQRLLRFAGLDPDHALACWGIHGRTIFLPATVFEIDDTGRSFRFKPNVSSIWVGDFAVKGPVEAYFQAPDLPELGDVVKGTGAQIIEGSTQTTNSWGLRGPEPDLTASWRGIVLGDSTMQGVFVGELETPTECLKRNLQGRLKASVEILNTGHLGYSPEQYYYTLIEYSRRFPPQFVVISLGADDFGSDVQAVLSGKGDWEEGCYWLAEIRDYCFKRSITFLFVPVPWHAQLEDAQTTGFYPGLVSNYIRATSQNYFDPIADFVNAQLTVSIEAKDQPPGSSSLFDPGFGGGHLTARGAELWAAAVGRRLGLVLGLLQADRETAKRDAEAGLGENAKPDSHE